MDRQSEQFIELLWDANEKQNLFSRQATRQDLYLHYEDSLTLTRVMDLTDKTVIDIGSGQGFPAIPLAIACPRARLALIESDLKKSAFLQETVEALALDNVKVIRARAEELAHEPDHRRAYDVVTVRGVTQLPVLVEWCMPFLRTGGTLAAWKGPNFQHELAESQNALHIMTGFFRSAENYNLDGKARVLALFEKSGIEPAQYPRRGGIAKKRPL